MKKSDLKEGWIVQTRNGTIWVVFNNTLEYEYGWEDLDSYNENLIACGKDIPPHINKEYDIVKVGNYLGKKIFDLDLYNPNLIEWIWERPKYVLTVEELELLNVLKNSMGCLEFATFSHTEEISYRHLSGYNAKGVPIVTISLYEYGDDCSFYNFEDNSIYTMAEVFNSYTIKEKQYNDA